MMHNPIIALLDDGTVAANHRQMDGITIRRLPAAYHRSVLRKQI